MSRATLIARPAPELAPDAVLYIVDCDHGRTEAAMLPGPVPIPEAVFVRLAVAKHYSVEGCRCTRHLRRRYGVTT